MRQLVNYGRDGLPVMSIDGQQLEGWLTSPNVLQAIARQMATALAAATPPAHQAAGWALADQQPAPDDAPVPLRGYQVVEVTIGPGSPAVGHTLGETTWPPGWAPVSGPGRPHAPRPRPGRHPQPRRPRQPAWPGDGWPRPPGPTRRPGTSPACPKRHPRPDQRTTVRPGAHHYASSHRLLVVQERGNRGGDLGSVGRQRRRHPEQGFGKPPPFAHSLQAGYEHPARRQANDARLV